VNTSVLTAEGESEESLETESSMSGPREIPTSPEPELRPGTSIQGKYVVHGVLGYGGFAVVYDAEHLGLGRRVAIKVLHLREDRPLALIERFRREARISALVKHPNVLEVYDTGALPDGSPFLVMERLHGETLSASIARGPLPIATVVELGRQMMRGLGAVHEAGIVHRDIKPDNVMLHAPPDGPRTVKLVDFGIARRVGIEPAARLTCHGALVGTPQYMSPEQIRGEDVDVRTDIYSTGAVLYEALTGHAPHECDNFSELVVAVLNAKLERVRKRRASCPPELEHIVMRALSRDRTQRQCSARELLAALEEVAYFCGLPSGDAAFGAEDRTGATVERAARGSVALARRLLPTIRASRPLQLTLLALLVGAPGSVGHVYGEGAVEASTTARVAPVAPTSSAASLTGSALPLGPVTTMPLVDDTRRVDEGDANASSDSADESESRSEGGSPVRAPRERGEPRASSAESRESASESSVEPSESRAASAPVVASEEPTRALVREAAPSEPAPAEVAPAAAPAVAATPVSQAAAARRVPRAAWEQAMESALAALVRGRLEAAKGHYQEAVRLDPREPSGFRGLSLVAARLGQAREAREALARYVSLAPQAKDAPVIAARIAALPK